MTSPYSGATASMYEQMGEFNQQELEQRYKISKDEIGARLKMAGMESKDRRYGIDQQRDSEREKLAHLRDEMERIGIPRMQIEKYIAEKTYEIAAAEMSLKRDIFVEETAQARQKLQLEREEMERIGIPQMEINRYVAEQNAAIARGQLGVQQGQLGLDRDKYRSDDDFRRAELAQQGRQFNTTASGYMQQAPTLTREQQSRYQQIRAADEQSRAAGGPGVSSVDQAELAGYQDILAGRAPNPLVPGGGGPGQRTLEGEELDRQYQLDVQRFGAEEAERRRRYALDVSKFGAELASTPDTYFQARRFQGVDVPRLMGGAGAATADPSTSSGQVGGPTPGVATMGAYLGGYDPYGAPPAQAPGAGLPPGAPSYAPTPTPGGPTLAPGGGAPLSPEEQTRYMALVARARQLNAAGEAVPPADADELARFQSRTGAPRLEGSLGMVTYTEPAFQGGQPEPMLGISDPGFDPNAARWKAIGGPMNEGPDSLRYATQATPSAYGGPAVSASVGTRGYAEEQRPTAIPSELASRGTPYPSQDPRQKQLAALAKALPPSPYDGLNDQDSAALKAMESIYKGGGQQIAGGEYERLKSSGRMGFLSSAGKLLGYDPKELESQYASYRPAQGSSRMAG